MATSKLTKMPPNLHYTSTGLTPTRCTVQEGGYTRFGNIVFVNIRIVASSSAAQVSGFPKPIASSYNYVGFSGYDGTNEKAVFGYMSPTGVLSTPSAYSPIGTYMISFAYLTED